MGAAQELWALSRLDAHVSSCGFFAKKAAPKDGKQGRREIVLGFDGVVHDDGRLRIVVNTTTASSYVGNDHVRGRRRVRDRCPGYGSRDALICCYKENPGTTSARTALSRVAGLKRAAVRVRGIVKDVPVRVRRVADCVGVRMAGQFCSSQAVRFLAAARTQQRAIYAAAAASDPACGRPSHQVMTDTCTPASVGNVERCAAIADAVRCDDDWGARCRSGRRGRNRNC